MPTIAMFYGMIVQMYSDDHNLPHIHVRYAESNVPVIKIEG